MKVFLTIVILALSAATASAKCGNMSTARMFDDTGVKQRVERSDRGTPTTNRRNLEAPPQRARGN